MRITVLFLLVACKRYEANDLVAICRGTGYERAAAYDPNAAGDGDVPLAMVYKYAALDDWTLNTPVEFRKARVVAPTKDNHERVSLALCVEQQPGSFALDCNMDTFNSRIEVGGGDPKVDVKKTGNSAVVKAHHSHYVLTVREARTARVLATKELDAKAEQCPMIVLGRGSIDYATLDERELVTFVAPHLPKAAAARLSAELNNESPSQ